jgi:hypothetical protein
MGYCQFVKGERGERVKVPGCMVCMYDDGCPCKTYDMANRAERISELIRLRDGINEKLAELGHPTPKGTS